MKTDNSAQLWKKQNYKRFSMNENEKKLLSRMSFESPRPREAAAAFGRDQGHSFSFESILKLWDRFDSFTRLLFCAIDWVELKKIRCFDSIFREKIWIRKTSSLMLQFNSSCFSDEFKNLKVDQRRFSMFVHTTGAESFAFHIDLHKFLRAFRLMTASGNQN